MKEGQDQMAIVVNGNEWEQNLSKLGVDWWKQWTDVRTQSLFPGDSAEYDGPLLGFNTRAPETNTQHLKGCERAEKPEAKPLANNTGTG